VRPPQGGPSPRGSVVGGDANAGRSIRLGPALVAVVALAACGDAGRHPRPAQLDTVEQVAARLAAGRSEVTAFRALTLSDYWLAGQRYKGEVKIMGTVGAKVRFNALSPAGGSVLLDLVCDGAGFVLLDNQHGCVRTGPCDETSIAQLLHVPLSPDDFFYLALGRTPVLDGATGAVTWDGKRGFLVAELAAATGAQTIEIDARGGAFDVVKSELRDPAGNLVWRVTSKDFAAVGTVRVPGSNRFVSSAQNSDVIVEYRERDVNIELPAQAFVLPSIAGLGVCP
jgi:hypothetical protein